MGKIKLTKGELKRQRDSLSQFSHYLPTLQLKKQQIQMKILEARKARDGKRAQADQRIEEIKKWAGLLADPSVDLTKWIKPEHIAIDTVNIAGANVPVFRDIQFPQADYDLYATPLWLDQAIKELRQMMTLLAEIMVMEKTIEILRQELRITTQRVNLFEKVKIPQCIDNIRIIRIYLGDQQANAVGVSKVAKKKIEERIPEVAFA